MPIRMSKKNGQRMPDLTDVNSDAKKNKTE